VNGAADARGLSQTTARIRSGGMLTGSCFVLGTRSHIFSLLLLLITVFVFFSSVWLALFLSSRSHGCGALADAMDEIATGKYNYAWRLPPTGEMGDLVRALTAWTADLECEPQLVDPHRRNDGGNLAIEERRGAGDDRRDDSAGL